MSTHYPTIFHRDTGQIVSSQMFSVEDDQVDINFAVRLDLYGGQDHDFIDAPADPMTQYVVMTGGDAWGNGTPTLVPRPELAYFIDKTTIVADGQDFATITELHNPCTIVIDSPDPTTETTEHTVTGGGFEFSADTPGLYTLQISKFPFLPATIKIMAS